VVDGACIEALVEIVIVAEINKIRQDKGSLHGDEIDQPYSFSKGGTNEIQKRNPGQGQDRQTDQKRQAKIELKPKVEGSKKF
jgi:hypothetical protein